MKYQQRIFWRQQHCSKCDHRATTVYTPELLTGPVQSECLRRECGLQWSLAVEKNGPAEKRIRDHVRLAERLAKLIDEMDSIKRILNNDA